MPPGIGPSDLPLVTDRLILRRYEERDAGEMFQLLSQPEVVRYLYSEPMVPERTQGALAERMQPIRLESENDALKLVAELRTSGEYVGEMSLFCRSLTHRRGEIGYIVAPRFAGLGLAQEGAGALLRVGFERVGFHRIEAQCDARNLASARVMERIGMRREAHFQENEFVKGEWTDAFVYAVLKDEWTARQIPL